MGNINDLRPPLLLLPQDEEDQSAHLFPKLMIGHVWWIPDEKTGFSDRKHHPWIIVEDYQPSRPIVYACPRTSRLEPPRPGLHTPANLLPGLDKEGVILFRHRQTFDVEIFLSLKYIGCLPAEWLIFLRKSYWNEQIRRRG